MRVLILLLIAALTGSHAMAANWTTDDLLWAIAQVETGGNSKRVGRAGERGALQFRQTTWAIHTKSPFKMAHNESVAFAVGRRHVDYLKQQIRRSDAWSLAAAWNAGPGAVRRQAIPRSTRDYATRVTNLVNSRVAERLSSSTVLFARNP